MSYDVVARLGRGGMGVVDLARDAGGRLVACKRISLHGSAADMARARQRLRREAEVLAHLDHPRVVRLIDVIDDGDEIVLVMPYLPGGSLADRVRRDGPLATGEVERLADRLVGALAAAHRAGVVHRDITPSNVLYDASGEPSLADFGVARAPGQTMGLTLEGTVVGTAGFMPPEQARGEPTGPPGDVFSLGATLLFAATGTGPYGHGDPAVVVVRAAGGKVARPPADLPADLRRLLRAMLDPHADRRPSAAALAGGRDGTTVGPAAVPQARRALPRPRPAMVAGLAGIVALAGAAFVLGGGPGSEDPPAPDADPACTDLPYQPCGQAEPAPFTDGTRCTGGHDDYDGDAANGCEAAPDDLSGTALVDELTATIVPRDDVDEYTFDVGDGLQLLCDGTLEVTLDAPAPLALHVEVRDGDRVLGEATSAEGRTGVVRVQEPSCFGDDSTTLTALVRPIGAERSADGYVLARSGSF